MWSPLACPEMVPAALCASSRHEPEMAPPRADSCRPASVKAIRREVRLNSRVLTFASSRLTAFETVAFESLSSASGSVYWVTPPGGQRPKRVDVFGEFVARSLTSARPPYAPELNPKENLWDEIREKIFKNYALKSINAVHRKLEEAILYIERNPKFVRSITSFPYIVKSF
jgi:hypothetical protein